MNDLTIDRKTVQKAALHLLDHEGIDSVNLTEISEYLRCRPEDVLQTIPNQESLLDAICDAIYTAIEYPPPELPWSNRIRHYAKSFRQTILTHPNAAVLIATRPILSKHSLKVIERTLKEIVAVGFTPDEANQILLVIASFVTGHTLTEIGGSPGSLREAAVDLSGRRSQLKPNELPIAAQAFAKQSNRDAEFELGLDFIIGGLERKLLHAAP